MRYVSIPKGGTLSKIAQQEHIPLKALLFTNANLDPRRIQIGQKIAVPETEDDLLAVAEVHKERIHKTIESKPEKDVGNEPKRRCGKCYCHRDFTVEEIKKIIGVHHLFSWKNCPLPKNEKNYERLTEELNKTMKKYKITSCLQKAHFLSQCAHESANFQTTVEGYGYKASYAPYYGRGLIQLTHGLSNYKKYSNFKGIDFVKNPNLIANKLNLTCDVSGWYWRFGSVWGDLNIYADKDDCLRISLGVNGGMNGYNDRKMKVKKYIRTMQIQTKCKNLHLTKPLGIYKYTTSDAKNKSWARKHRNMLEKYDD